MTAVLGIAAALAFAFILGVGLGRHLIYLWIRRIRARMFASVYRSGPEPAQDGITKSWWLMYEPMDDYREHGRFIQLGYCEGATLDEATELCREAVAELVYRTRRTHMGRSFVVPEEEAKRMFCKPKEVAN